MNQDIARRLIAVNLYPDAQSGFGSRAYYDYHLENILAEIKERGYRYTLCYYGEDCHFLYWKEGDELKKEEVGAVEEDAVALALLDIVGEGE